MPEKSVVVAFQGESGAFSEVAVHRFFDGKTIAKPYRILPEVFDAIEKGKVDHAVVPIENSTEGSVNETYDLMLKTDVKVCAELNLRIVHCLISLPTVSKEDVKVVYSHPQALGQCRAYLQKNNYRTLATYDTAGSVKLLKEQNLREAAAIASEYAAEFYGMKALEKGIEDNKNNYTRFFLLAEKDAKPTGSDKTSIIFSTPDKPGSLQSVLKEFADRKINLTKIESRPTRQKAWEYYFYLDFEGHRSDKPCAEVLKIVSKNCPFVKVLGSYPKAK